MITGNPNKLLLKKSYLKEYMIVELRNGERYFVQDSYCGLGLMGHIGKHTKFLSLDDFNDELESNCHPRLDIVRVFRLYFLPKELHNGVNLSFNEREIKFKSVLELERSQENPKRVKTIDLDKKLFNTIHRCACYVPWNDDVFENFHNGIKYKRVDLILNEHTFHLFLEKCRSDVEFGLKFFQTLKRIYIMVMNVYIIVLNIYMAIL